MERLTERELYDGKVCFTKCSKTNCLDTCTNCDITKEANVRLKEYEDLEEKGKLLKLPCAVGDKMENLEMTNADRIRSMNNEDLLDFLCSIQTYDEGSVKTIENGVAMCSVSDVEKWLESEAK